jgi:hypothetical protein
MGLLYKSVRYVDYIALDDKIDELKKTAKCHTVIKVLAQHLPGGTAKYHTKPLVRIARALAKVQTKHLLNMTATCSIHMLGCK